MSNAVQPESATAAAAESAAVRPAFLVPGTERYGVGEVAVTSIMGLGVHGVNACVVSLGEGYFTERCAQLGIECHVLDLPPIPTFQGGRVQLLKGSVQMRAWQRNAVPIAAATLQRLSVKQLVVQRPVHVEFAGRTAARAGIGCYWMMPNIISDRWMGMNRRWYQHVCQKWNVLPLPDSRYTGSTLGSGVRQEVLYYGVNDQRFNPDRVQPLTRAEIGLPEGSCVMAIFARLEHTKGQHVFWEALASVIASGADIHLLLLGGPTDGPIANRMREVALARGMTDRLHFAGFTREPERYYGAIDVAVNSRIDPEPFGLSVVEAMLMQTPVLVHALGGPAETVVDGKTGWHVHEPTVEGFAAGIRRVMADRGRWPEMGITARQHALENFSLSRFGTNFIRIATEPKSNNV